MTLLSLAIVLLAAPSLAFITPLRSRQCRSNQLVAAPQCEMLGRRAVAAQAASFAVLLLAQQGASAVDSETIALLKQARAQLEPCAGLIEAGSWDGVRTVVKTAPLQNANKLITKYISESGEAAEDLVIPREDLVQALQFLDMTVYNNNFISEQNAQGKKGAGVKIDRETPMKHLQESKDALDEVLAFKP